MGREGYQPEQIIAKLREAEILLSTGHSVRSAARQIGRSPNRHTIDGVKSVAV